MPLTKSREPKALTSRPKLPLLATGALVLWLCKGFTPNPPDVFLPRIPPPVVFPPRPLGLLILGPVVGNLPLFKPLGPFPIPPLPELLLPCPNTFFGSCCVLDTFAFLLSPNEPFLPKSSCVFLILFDRFEPKEERPLLSWLPFPRVPRPGLVVVETGAPMLWLSDFCVFA